MAAGEIAAVKPELGLVCVTAGTEVRFRALTRTRLLQRGEAERPALLRELYADNLRRVETAIAFCEANGIRLYRLSSALFPFADIEIGSGELDALAPELARIGERATASGIRLLMHPEQFVVLNSDTPQIIENSRQTLDFHARVLDNLQQPRSPWATLILHGGKGGRSERLIETIETLPERVRLRLALENDEDVYGPEDILAICRAVQIPMVYDVHHHVCKAKLTTYDDPAVAEMFWAARDTWHPTDWQLTHISNGRETFGDNRHSDMITAMPGIYRFAPWIEVEAKGKDLAIGALRDCWLPSAIQTTE